MVGVNLTSSGMSCLFGEPVLFPLVKLVFPDGAHVDNFGTTVPVFFELDTFLTIVGIRSPNAVTNETSILVGSIVALVTNSH
jgi:hypothetical protein